MSRFDTILSLLKKSGQGIGAELGGAGDDVMKYLKGSGVSSLDKSLGVKPKGLMADVSGLGGKASKLGEEAVSGLGGSGQDYLRAGKSMFGSPGPMRPEDIKKMRLLQALGLLGAGGAAAGGGYAMMDDEDE